MLSEVWCGHIDSWERLRHHVIFTEPPVSFRNRFRALTNDNEATFRSLFESFMEGAGVPNTHLFSQAKAHFNDAVDLTRVDEEGYRARMFSYAATGSFDRESDSPRISVSLSFAYITL